MGRRHALTAAALGTALLAGCAGTSSTGGAPSASGTAAAPSTQASPAATSSAPSPAPTGGGVVKTWTAPDGTQVQYVLVVPPGRTVGAPGKVLLTFPPGGQQLGLAGQIVAERWRDEAVARDWVVVSPARTDKGLWYEPTVAALVPALLDEVAKSYPPEGGRFDLAGVSNGGLSAFAAAEGSPQRFRSLVVFPGMPDRDDPKALAGLEGLGTAFFVGALDPGWLEGSQKTAAALKAMGNTVEVHVIAGQGHIIETLTGADLFDAMERVRG